MTSEVAERPAEAADTQTEAPVETQDATLGVTDEQAPSAQTAETPDVETAEPEESPEQHEAKLEADRLEAERLAIREEERQRIEQEKVTEQRQQREATRKAAIRNARQNALAKTSAIAAQFAGITMTDADGDEVSFDSKALVNVIEALNLDIETAINERLSEEYQEQYHAAFAEKLGADAEAFWQEAEELQEEDGNIPVPALLELYAEKRALQAKVTRTMTLEAAKAASPTVARELAAALKAEYDKGRKSPLPAGEPDTNGNTSISGARPRSQEEADALHVGGFITNAQRRVFRDDPRIPQSI